MASERLDVPGEKSIQGLLLAGDPYGEVRDAWYAKEGIRDIYQIERPATGLGVHLLHAGRKVSVREAIKLLPQDILQEAMYRVGYNTVWHWNLLGWL